MFPSPKMFTAAKSAVKKGDGNCRAEWSACYKYSYVSPLPLLPRPLCRIIFSAEVGALSSVKCALPLPLFTPSACALPARVRLLPLNPIPPRAFRLLHAAARVLFSLAAPEKLRRIMREKLTRGSGRVSLYSNGRSDLPRKRTACRRSFRRGRVCSSFRSRDCPRRPLSFWASRRA